jgi:hypothetical protein
MAFSHRALGVSTSPAPHIRDLWRQVALFLPNTLNHVTFELPGFDGTQTIQKDARCHRQRVRRLPDT